MINIETFSPLQKKILIILKENGPMKRSDLVIALNSKRTTIYNNWEKLAKHQLVDKYEKPDGSRGRPLVFFRCLEKGSEVVTNYLE